VWETKLHTRTKQHKIMVLRGDRKTTLSRTVPSTARIQSALNFFVNTILTCYCCSNNNIQCIYVCKDDYVARMLRNKKFTQTFGEASW
jgi:hypothetical protein